MEAEKSFYSPSELLPELAPLSFVDWSIKALPRRQRTDLVPTNWRGSLEAGVIAHQHFVWLGTQFPRCAMLRLLRGLQRLVI